MYQEYSILISASPEATQTHLTAIRFVKEAINKQHKIRSVFFYQDGVLVANKLLCPPSDEPSVTNAWQSVAEIHNIELQTCVAASYRRGVIDQQQANEMELKVDNLADKFTLTGLGQLAAAMSDDSVKLIHFK